MILVEIMAPTILPSEMSHGPGPHGILSPKAMNREHKLGTIASDELLRKGNR